MMDHDEKEKLIKEVWAAMKVMDEQERIDFIDECMQNYCHDCGSVEIGRICHCENDDQE